MDSDITFTVKGNEYSAGKLDAKRQFHITRRLLPLMGGFIKEGHMEGETSEAAIAAFLKIAGNMEDEQLDYIFDHCLAVVKRKDGDISAQITAPIPNGKRAILYEDIDMMAMLIISFNVIKRNLSSFFDALPSDLAEKFRGAMSAT